MTSKTLAYEYEDCASGDRVHRESSGEWGVEWENPSSPDWLKVFLNFCLLFMCVLLLERENLVLRGEVALGGNKKALGLYIEMWLGEGSIS